MPRVTFVKSARKENPVAKPGESYYWWKFRYGPKHYSKTSPRQSQLTQSTFLSTVWAAEELFSYDYEIEGKRDAVDLEELRDDAVQMVQDVVDEAESSFDNMPEGLQYGPTGELLESRRDEGQEMIDQYESVDFNDYDGPDVPEEGRGAIPEEFIDWLEGKLEELQAVSYGGE